MNIDRNVFTDSSRYFTPVDSAQRLLFLRRCFFGAADGEAQVISPLQSAERRTGDASAPECILLIGGVDSKNDPINAALLNFLLAGTERPVSDLLQEVVWDVVVVFTLATVDVYVGPKSVAYLNYITAAWPGCRLHYPPYQDFGNESDVEDAKVEAFRVLAASFDRVGVLSATGLAGIERWPLVQSFAVDPLGGRPFFSLAKTVVDALPLLKQTCASLATEGGAAASHCWQRLEEIHDSAYAIRRVLLTSVTVLHTQWNAFLTHWTSSLQSNSQASTAELLEPLQVYQQYATHQGNEVAEPPTLQLNRERSNMSVVFADPGPGKIKVARTYALSRTAPNLSQALKAAQVLGQGHQYTCRNLDGLVTHLHSLLDPQDGFVIHQEKRGNHLAFISLKDGKNSGSIFYGDTFLLLEKEGSSEAIAFNVTKGVPNAAVLESTVARVSESAALKQVVDAQMDVPPSRRATDSAFAQSHPSFKQLGKLLDVASNSDGVSLVINAELTGHESASALYLSKPSIAFFEKGFVAMDRSFGHLLLPFRAPKEAAVPANVAEAKLSWYHHPSDTSEPIAFCFEVPSGTLGDSAFKLIVLIQPNSSARKDLVSEWLPTWKQEESSEFWRSISLPEDKAAAVVGTFKTQTLEVPRDVRATSPQSSLKAATIAMEFYHGTVVESVLSSFESNPDRLFLTAGNVPQLSLADSKKTTQEGSRPNAGKEIDVIIISGPISSEKHKLVGSIYRTLQQEGAERRRDGSSLGVLAIQPEPFDEHVTLYQEEKWLAELEAFLQGPTMPQGGYGMVIFSPPPFTALPQAFAFWHWAANRLAPSGVTIRIRHSLVVISPETYFAASPNNIARPSPKQPSAWSSSSKPTESTVLPISAFSRLSLAAGYFNGVVFRSAAPGKASEALLPEVLAAVEQSVAECTLSFAGKAPYAAFYSFLDARDAVIDLTSTRLVPIESATTPVHPTTTKFDAIRSSITYNYPAIKNGSDSALVGPASANNVNRIRHIVLRLDRMLITESNVMDFFSYAASKDASTRDFGVVYCLKAFLQVGARPVEITTVALQPHSKKYQEKKALTDQNGDIVVRHSQEFHLFVDNAKMRAVQGPGNRSASAIKGVRARRSEAEIFRQLHRELERQLSTTDSILLSLVEARHKLRHRLILTKDSLTEADLVRIAEKAREISIPLPPGWKLAADGTGYTQEENPSAVVRLRPDIAELAEKYLAELCGETDSTGKGPFSALAAAADPLRTPPPPAEAASEEEDEDQ
jgi:hypothetical protein